MENISEAKQLIDRAKRIVIVSHRKPDPDTLGAAVALKLWLAGEEGKDVALACVDQPEERFRFMPEVENYVQDFDMDAYDLAIVVDAGAAYMTQFHLKYPDFLEGGIDILNIDHHASNDYFGKVNLVDPEMASTTLLIYFLFMQWEVYINEDMATALMAGLYGDTGSFMHSNTSSMALNAAADLFARGANLEVITKNLFNRNSITSLKLWGKVLERAYVTDDNVVMSVVHTDDYEKLGAAPEELSGVIDYLNMVPDSKFALLVNEDGAGNVKGSLRTRNEDIDLSQIAKNFGGGGHPKASGFTIQGRLRQKLAYDIISMQDSEKKTLEF